MVDIDGELGERPDHETLTHRIDALIATGVSELAREQRAREAHRRIVEQIAGELEGLPQEALISVIIRDIREAESAELDLLSFADHVEATKEIAPDGIAARYTFARGRLSSVEVHAPEGERPCVRLFAPLTDPFYTGNLQNHTVDLPLASNSNFGIEIGQAPIAAAIE